MSERNGRPRVVVAGGGVAALEALLVLRTLLGNAVAIELVTPERQFVYRPLAVTEPFEIGDAPRFDLAQIADDQNAQYLRDRVVGVDTGAQMLHSSMGSEIKYDALLVSVGAELHCVLSGALTYRGEQDVAEISRLLAELEQGTVKRVAFVVPPGVAWPLPLYELALMTSAHLRDRDVPGVTLTLATPEDLPLGIFGRRAGEQVAAILANFDIELRTSSETARIENGKVKIIQGADLEVDRVIALPRLFGGNIAGLPQDADGFLDVDEHNRVCGLTNVYAAGDITNFPVKQGGIATQQADAAAESIAAQLGGTGKPTPFRPVLRGLLFSAEGPHYVRTEIAGGAGEGAGLESNPLWWPSGKIVGRYLSKYLAGAGGALAAPAVNGSEPLRPRSWISKSA